MNDTTDAKLESFQAGGDQSNVLESFVTTDETDSIGGYRSSGRIASMPESDFLSQHYAVKDRIGRAVIINNKTFSERTGMGKRPGTDTDAVSMQTVLITIGFQVERFDDLRADEIKNKLQQVASDDHSSSSSFLCVILTHGEEGYVFGTDDRVSLDDLVAPFKGDKCLSLAGKPKIFLIQACRAPEAGYEGDDGMEEEMDYDKSIRRIPTEADFLIALSVVPGCLVWNKSPKANSWFVKAIHDVFLRNWNKLDLMTMMTRVNKIVADEFETKNKAEFDKRKKQIPCITSMLVKDFYFFKR
ncbi:caspase-3-like [Biomphalaria glabrata]|uniref:Caspase-3-like n=1 Tax=Biomphalaria glabrata TaxID=6526 RepID=A0A9W2ZN36_BIOGL|nr:caspase-3-like [Biomphalaria glabrata]